jgi:hypothetical protein
MFWDIRIRGTVFVCLVVALVVVRSVFAEISFEERDFPETAIPSSRRDRVKVELYYMPQCPGCRQLITTSFSEAFQTPGFSDMVDVTFVPWGRAFKNIESSGSLEQIQQQQQEQEQRVFDNVLESCALDTIGRNHQDQQFAYIECIDRTNTFEKDPSKVDRSCAKVIGLSTRQTRKIEACAISRGGHNLAERNLRQSELVGMKHAPWIVVDRQHTPAIEDSVWESLFGYVCGIYSGPHKSEACPDTAGEDKDLFAEQL